MNRIRLLLGAVFVMVLLAACSGGPASADAKCLVGTWKLDDHEVYGRISLPPGAVDQNTTKFNRAGGRMLYEFKDNGIVSVQASKWATRFQVDDVVITYLDLVIDGVVNAEYSVDGNKLTIGAVTEGELSFVATMEGEVMMYTRNADEFAPLFVTAYNTAEFECSEDTLSVKVLKFPGVDEPITFTRVE